MTLATLALVLPLMLGALLLSAGLEDVRKREIANWKNAAIALLAPLWWVASGLQPWPDMAWQAGLCLAVLAVFCVAFYFGQMGGGDVKMLAALGLWLPAGPLLSMLIVMSIVGGIITVAMLVERWWRSGKNPVEVPYGVAIAIAALLTSRELYEPIFNHFT